MIRGFKYRFYPTPAQEHVLAKTFGCVRYVYNWALRLRSDAWLDGQKRVNFAHTSAALTRLKHTPDHEWLNEVSAVALQQSLRHLQDAFVNFWMKRAHYPHFKKAKNKQSADFTGTAFYWDGQDCSVAKIGKLDIRWSRRFSGPPSSITVSRDCAGRYFVAFRVDEPLPSIPAGTGAVGLDLGLQSFVTTSSGEAVSPLRRRNSRMRQLKRAQKAFARKCRGSKNAEAARLRLAKIHAGISDARQDFLHKISTRLVRENQTIVVEDLNTRGMMRNRTVAGAIGDAGWAAFVAQLEYKCAWYGRSLVKIDRFYPSSKRCSACGFVKGSMPLDIRHWVCPECGAHHDRDVNAARNILAAGLAVAACGDGVRPSRSKGREGDCQRSRNRDRSCA